MPPNPTEEGCSKKPKRRRHSSSPVIKENVLLEFHSPISIIESIDNDINTRKIKGMALPAQESRNGRTYAIEDIKNAKFKGKTFERGNELLIGLNHSEDITDVVGRWSPTFEEAGIGFMGKAFNTGKHPYIADMLDKRLMPFVSIEAMADLVKEKDTLYAKNLDILAMDFVKTPGMSNASVGIAESFERALENSDTKEIGDEMTNEEKDKLAELAKEAKIAEEAAKLKAEEDEKTKLAEAEKAKAEKQSSAIDKVFDKLDVQSKAVEELSNEIKKLKEKPKSKGVITGKEEKPEFTLIIKDGKKGKDIYSEDILY